MRASKRAIALLTLALLSLVGPLTAQLDPDTVITPRNQPTTAESEENLPFTETPPFLTIGIYIVLMLGVGFVVYKQVWRGGFSLKRNAGTTGIRITESKPLGNKQYIVVVECDDQRMMLGVGPGFINHLCFLDQTNPATDDAIDLPDNEERQ